MNRRLLQILIAHAAVVLLALGATTQLLQSEANLAYGASTIKRLGPTPARSEFRSYGLYVDSNTKALAAYQIEILDSLGASNGAKLVGIEGGDHPAFRAPAFYDPAALQGSRIVLAALSTAADLPRGRTRVASLHFRVDGDAPPEFVLRLQAAQGADGEDLDVKLQLSRES